jgi:hypothetical protein
MLCWEKIPISCIMDQLVCICLKGWILKADHCAEKYKAVLLSLFFVVVEKGSMSHVEIQLSYNTCVSPKHSRSPVLWTPYTKFPDRGR